MDSDEDDEYSFAEGERPDHHGGKLKDILSEVETKIPTLEFDDNDDDEHAYDIWKPPNDLPLFYKQFMSYEAPLKQESEDKNQIGTNISSSFISSPTDALDSTSILNDVHGYPSLATCGTDSLDGKLDPILDSESVSSSTRKHIDYHQPSSFMCQTNIDLVSCSNDEPSTSSKKSSGICENSPFKYTKDSDQVLYGHDLTSSVPVDTRCADLELSDAGNVESDVLLSMQNGHLVHDQKLPFERAREKYVIPKTQSLSLFSQLENQVIHNNQDTLNDERSPISMQSLVSQTENPSISCGLEHQSSITSSEKLVDAKQISSSVSASILCQAGEEFPKIDEPVLNSKNVETDQVVEVLDSNGQSYIIGESGPYHALDLNVLSRINFKELHTALGTRSERTMSDLLSSTSSQNEEPPHQDDSELMLRLSHLSKDQLNACSSVQNKTDSAVESSYPKEAKIKGNVGSARTIHSWSQLSNDESSDQEPQTIFLDLRQEAILEKEKEEKQHAESVQRILGLTVERSTSSSDSESENEYTKLREMREKIKGNAKIEPENHKESAHARVSMLNSKPSSLRAPCNLQNHHASTVKRLSRDELTGSVPPHANTTHVNAKKNLKFCPVNPCKTSDDKRKAVGEESPPLSLKEDHHPPVATRAAVTGVEADSGVSSDDGYMQNDECILKKKNKARGSSQIMTREERVIGLQLNRTKLKTQNNVGESLTSTDENACSETFTISRGTNTHGSTFDGSYSSPNESGEKRASSDSGLKHESCHTESGMGRHESGGTVDIRPREIGGVQLEGNRTDENSDEKHAISTTRVFNKTQNATFTCKSGESNAEQEAASLTTSADITFSLRLSRPENHNKSNGFVRLSSAMKNDESRYKSRVKGSGEMQEISRYKTKPAKTRNAGTSTHHITNQDHFAEETIKMNGYVISRKQELSNDVPICIQDLHSVYKIVENMKEKNTKQSLTSNLETTPANSSESKQANKSKMNTSLLQLEKPQKQRSQKELKKLKEKLRTNIENMRPIVTASGKYPTACNTPIIYDQEASFEAAQRGLLSTAENHVSLLLVITLSGCGEINHQYCKGRRSENEVNHYFALLSWFLYQCSPYNNDGSVPFNVVGMQQVCQNGLLQLFIATRPDEKVFDPKAAKGKNKTHAFHKAISKYLSTHSLRSVYQNMEKVYLNGNIQLDENAYSSKMLSTCITVGQDSNAVQRVFNSKPGFYWETIELEGSNEAFQSSSCDVNVENTVVFVRAPLYYHPSCVLDLFNRMENEGCDVVGLRLTHEHDFSVDWSGEYYSRSRSDLLHTLALAVKGPFAIAKMKNIIGSKNPLIDNGREIPSLRSLYCSTSVEDTMFYSPSYSNQAATQLARVFGGRLAEDDIVAVEECHRKTKPCSPDIGLVQKPPAFLVSSTRVAFYLVVSPLVPPSFLGELLHICFGRGFVLHGARRVQLSKRQVANLGLSQLQFTAFCPGNSPFQSPSESPPGSPVRVRSLVSLETTLALGKPNKSPSTILILQKENGLHHAASLLKCLHESLKDWMASNSSSVGDPDESLSRMYLTIAQFNDANSKSLWGDIRYKPDTRLLKRARNSGFSSNSELEQVCVLSSCNKKAIEHFGIFLKMLYSANNPVSGNWELLGIKTFPSLSLVQAREVTPDEIGDCSWQSNVKLLMSTFVFVCVLRGINIIRRLQDFMAYFAKTSTKDGYVHEGWWLSQTTEVAYRQLTVLFEERELCSDETNRANSRFLPPLCQRSLPTSSQKDLKAVVKKKRGKWCHADRRATSTDESSTSVDTSQFVEIPIIQSLLFGPRPLPTVAVIKPSCMANSKKIGNIFKSILQEHFEIIALSMRVLTSGEAQVLVRDDEVNSKDHIEYLTSGASLVLSLQRENAVKKLLDILGPQDPIIARSLDPFFLRGCYGSDSIHNAIHGSESYSSGICELKMLFPCGVCCEQTTDLDAEQIPCRAFDATIGKKTMRKLTKNFTQQTDTTQCLINSLVQVNCVILSHHIVYGRGDRKRVSLVDVLECFFLSNFVPVGMKMAMLSREQVREFLSLTSKQKKKQKWENELVEGPCIILALQRDNAITCFDSITRSGDGKRRSIMEHRKHIIYASTEEEAINFLVYFFDELSPNSVHQICPI